MGLLKKAEIIKEEKVKALKLEKERLRKERLNKKKEEKKRRKKKDSKFNLLEIFNKFKELKNKFKRIKGKEKKNKPVNKKLVFNIVFTIAIVISLTIYILNKKGILQQINNWFWVLIAILVLTTLLGVMNLMIGKKNITKVIKKVLGSKKDLIIKTSEVYKTDIDRAYELIQEKGSINIKEVMKKFSINKKECEDWAEILEQNDLIEIHYPAFGEAELRVKK